MAAKISYEFEADDTVYRVSRERVSASTRFIDNLAKNSIFNLPNVFKIDNHPNPISMVVKSEYLIMCTRLDKLRINTGFSGANNKLIPEFQVNRNDYPNLMYLNLEWPIPENMKIFYAIIVMKDAYQSKGNRSAVQAYFWAMKTSGGGYYRLPLPNLYEHGQICLGTGIEQTIIRRDLNLLMADFIDLLHRSEWGSHLRPDMGRAKEMFSFNVDNTPSYMTGNWWGISQSINHKYIEEANEVLK